MSAQRIDASLLRSRLKLKNLQAESAFHSHHPSASSAFLSHQVRPGHLRRHAGSVASRGVLVASLMLPASGSLPISTLPDLLSASQVRPALPQDTQARLKLGLQPLMPQTGRELTPEVEAQISQLIFETLGIVSSAELEGNRLNDQYGYIGAEQHLPRFPGDTANQHDELPEAGITPGRGAWGYFADSKSSLTPDLALKEKYYFAVQTLYLPDWRVRLPYLREWYKYRKMIAINPANGRALVGVVADSGPAWWTGKQFGGSPEVMRYLQLRDGRQRGKIILFFVNDPNDSVPLGPIEYNLNKPPLFIAG